MVTFEISSDRTVTIIGIGVINKNTSLKLNDTQLKAFQQTYNKTIGEALFPKFITVTAVVDD